MHACTKTYKSRFTQKYGHIFHIAINLWHKTKEEKKARRKMTNKKSGETQSCVLCTYPMICTHKTSSKHNQINTTYMCRKKKASKHSKPSKAKPCLI